MEETRNDPIPSPVERNEPVEVSPEATRTSFQIPEYAEAHGFFTNNILSSPPKASDTNVPLMDPCGGNHMRFIEPVLLKVAIYGFDTS